MGFWEDLSAVGAVLNPVTLGPVALGAIAGDVDDDGSQLPIIGQPLTSPSQPGIAPGQVPGIAAGFANPSTQGGPPVQVGSVTPGPAVNGYSSAGPFGGASPHLGPANPNATPVYQSAPSLRDQVQAHFNASQRTAPKVQAAQMDRGAVRDVQAAKVSTQHMQPGMAVAQQGLGATAAGLGMAAGARGGQVDHTQRLTSAADGLAPSVAESQLRSGLAQGMQNNLAMAASARGSGSGAVLAQRQAMDANAALGARTNAQAAQLRAGEMAQARGELGQHLAVTRQGDLQSAGIGTQVAGIGTQMQGIGAQLGTAQAGLQQQAGMANQAADLSVGAANLNAQQATQLANLNAQLQTQGMDDQQRAMYLGAMLGIDARTQQGQQELQRLLVGAQLQTQAINAGVDTQNAQLGQNILLGGMNMGGALFGMGGA